MQGAAKGEHIARSGARSNVIGKVRCGNPKRVASSIVAACGSERMRPSGSRSTLWDAAGRAGNRLGGKRERGIRVKARIRLIAGMPWKGEPQGSIQRSMN
jgi:hypothetical protein